MKLHLNPRGIWEIRWTENRRSRRKSTGTRSKTEAEQTLAAWLRDRKVAHQDPSVTVILRRYLTGHALPMTADPARIQVMTSWLMMAFGNQRLSQLADLDFHRYMARRRKGDLGLRPAKDSTIRQELRCLRTALNYAVKVRLITAEQVPTIPLPDPAPVEYHWLTEPQVERMLVALEKEDQGARLSRAHRFVLLALATGARKGAIEQLTWAQVDLDARQLRYDRQVKRVSKKRRTAAPMPDWLVPHLARMEREAETDYVLDHPGDIRHCFEWAMKRVAAATGDNAYLAVNRHSMRHTCATLMLRAGATLWQVAGVLGDSPETVAATYGHHAQDHLQQAVNSWRRVS